jgi:PAS domain S-box-containing protein
MRFQVALQFQSLKNPPHARIGAALILGVALEAAVAVAFAGSERYVAVAAAIGLLVAVLAGAVGGWWVGLAVGAAGWTLHFFLVADESNPALASLPAWLAAGLAAGWLGTRLNREALRRQHLADELQAVRDGASEAIAAVDPEGTIAGWGAGAEALYGYSADDAVGQPLSLLDRNGLQHELVEAVEGGDRVEGLRRLHRRKDGSEVLVSVAIAPVVGEDGKSVGAVVVTSDVGEQVRLTEALHESEAKYRSLTAHLPDVTFVYPPGERVKPLYIGGPVDSMLGYSHEQLLSEPGLFAKLIHPDDRERVLAELEAAQESVEPTRADYRMLARDGRVVWVHDESATVLDPQGNPLYVQGYLRDVTGRHESEEEKGRIRAAEEAAAADGREKQRKLDFLAQANAVLGSSSDYHTTLRRVAELAVRDLADWCLVDILDEEESLLRLAAAHAEPRASRVPAPGPEPEPEVLEVVESLRPVLTESRVTAPLISRGRALGAITLVSETPARSFGRDDLAFVESLATSAALAVDDSRLQDQVEERADAARVLTYVADGVFLLDRAGVIRLWNPAAEAITGIDAAAVVGKAAVQGIHGWEGLAERIPVGVGASDLPEPATLPLETDRGERWISISGVEFFGGTVYAFRDLTETRRLEEMKAEFLSTASHELRTPLAAVYGAAQTLKRHDFALDESGRSRFITLIVDESERLGRIVNEILLANQLEVGVLDLATEPFDAVELVERVVEAMRLHAPPGIEIELTAHDGAPAVAADRDKVRQVLNNLVENAMKYSPDGGRIELAIERRDSMVRFAVRDEGLGIPIDEQARIFDKFYRLDPNLTRGVGGTGLGLYICSELVGRMGGRIWVETREPHGSAFMFELPADDTRGPRSLAPAREATGT